jgi:hypothetical protein
MSFIPFLKAAAPIVGGALGFFGSKKSSDATAEAARMNIAHQKEFAQKGIRWKVQDAKEAGLHPLAALGAQTGSFSPVSVGDQGAAYKSAGQSISNAPLVYAQLKESQARQEKDHAQAEYYSAMAANQKQKANSEQDREFLDALNPAENNILVRPQQTVGLGRNSDIQSYADKEGEIMSELRAIGRAAQREGKKMGIDASPAQSFRKIHAEGYRVRQGKLYKKMYIGGNARWIEVNKKTRQPVNNSRNRFWGLIK